jgi:hypothetical protein
MEQKVSGEIKYKISATGQVNKITSNFIYYIITSQ